MRAVVLRVAMEGNVRTQVIAVAFMLAAVRVWGQDAVSTLPKNYQVEFDNAYVRVTRVHYPAHAKLPGHTHTSLPSAYVYLNDSGPVVFKHIGLDYGAVTRPPTVARSFRLYRGLEEIHEVENQSATASHFLRVEFKTDPGPDPRTLRGKFLPTPQTEMVEKVEFENAQLRVTRLVAPAGRPVVSPASSRPGLLIALTADELGRASWVPPGETVTVSRTAAPAEALRFELKTNPRSSP